MRASLLALITTLCATSAAAQELIKSISVADTILYATVDRPGDFYAVTASGQIQKFDKDGRLLRLLKRKIAPTLFDARDGARLFAYFRHDQHYEFLSPSLQTTSSYKIDSSFAIQPWLICTAGDHKLWLLDRADNSLKKINVRESEVELEVMVDSALISDARAFGTMREYQNFVFLLDTRRGIFIFNNLGIHIRTIEEPGIRSFNFLGEDLYYTLGGQVKFFNLFTANTRQMSLDSGPGDALLTDERMILVRPLEIDIFAFRP